MMSFKSVPIVPIKGIMGLILRGALVLLILRLELLIVFPPSLIILSPGFIGGSGRCGSRGLGGGAKDTCAILCWPGGVGTRVFGERTWVGCGMMVTRRAGMVAASGGPLATEAVECGAAVEVG
jgi:hypothetical protein